jgi:dTDP-4-dehydrorhamnose 3,5-epimerase
LPANTTIIKGVAVKQLCVHSDDRGSLMEVLRADDPVFAVTKQTAYTEAFPGVIKAFHWHKGQKDIWFFATGAAQVVLYDLRPDAPTTGQTPVLDMGSRDPLLLCIPEYVAHGYPVWGTQPAGLLYHTTELYDPALRDEECIPFDDPRIGFD